MKQLGPRKPVAPIGPALRHELGELAPALPSPPAAGLSEAEYRERLHPRNRLGRWIDAPDVKPIVALAGG